jgi:iron complex transport system ATP-binding protein
MSTLLEGRDLAFAYGGRPVLRGVDFSLAPGELVAIVGPNGAGKSTLLHVLLGVLQPDAGSVHASGQPLRELDRGEIARRIAFVPQEARADFDFTVGELVAMGRTPYLGRFQPERSTDVEAVRHALEVTGTGQFAERLVSELSFGERQRVHVARAIAQTTDVLLLDEPTSNLDVAHQLDIMGLLRELTLRGKAAAVALHDLSLAARFADRVVVLSGGRIVANGRPGEVITEALLEEHFLIRARVHRGEPDGVVVVVPFERAGRAVGPDRAT